MTRAISTVLDVTVCLLLVAAAVGTLVITDPPRIDATADDTAEQLVATTANVSDPTGSRTRRAYGTHAELLARAAVANLTVSGHSVTPTSEGFRGAVHEQVARVLTHAPSRTAVTARWVPYPDAPVQGRLTVGPKPPETATVSTARFSVPVFAGCDRVESADTFETLARAMSERILQYTLSESRGDTVRLARFEERRQAYNRALGDPSADGGSRALGALLERDLRGRFATPQAAVDALRKNTVRVVVREWEP